MPPLLRCWRFLFGLATLLLVLASARGAAAFPGEHNVDTQIAPDQALYITSENLFGGCPSCHQPQVPPAPQFPLTFNQVNPVLTISGGTGSGTAFSVKPKDTATFTLTFNNNGPAGSGGFLLMHDPTTGGSGNAQGQLHSVAATGSHACPDDGSAANGTACGGVTNGNTEIMHAFPDQGPSSNFQFTYTAPALCSGTFSFLLWVNSENGDSQCFAPGDSPYPVTFTISIASCSDGDACNGTESCNAGQCQAGTPITCALPNQCQNPGVCSNGVCTYTPRTGAACSDGNGCTNGDVCTAAATCQPGAPVTCALPNQCQNPGVCSNGTCAYTPRTGSSCNDNDACTSGDVCTSGAVCQGTAVPIDDGNVCTADSCTPFGGVQHDPAAASTPCRAASCSNGPPSQATLGATCAGNTTCPAAIIVSCNGQVCAGTVCSGAGGGCAGNDANCVAGDFCLGTTCTPKLPNGQPCAADDFCQNGFCVDGVCCNSACGNGVTTDCQACNVTNQVGTCSAAVGNPCRKVADVCDVAEVCGASLTCPADGFAPASVACRAASCTAGKATLAANCPGPTVSGACPAAQTKSCSPYGCAGTACATTCAAKADCASGFFCNPSHQCAAELPQGGACTTAEACGTGICVDGRCCNSQCTGECQACDVPTALGVCSPITDKIPHGSRAKCTGDGTACQGVCDGVNTASCALPGSSTQCRIPSCTAGTATLGAACNGRGSCPAAQTQSCAPGVCQAATGPKAICIGSGGTGCVDDVECQADHYCSAGVCKPKINDGAACASDTQCKNGHCVDGLCCNSACTGQCEACDAPGSLGTCSAVTDPPHGGRPACVSDPQFTDCAGRCDGKNRLSCAFPGPGTLCRDASCSKGVATLSASCTGTGTCSPAQTQDCPVPSDCNEAGTLCAEGCSADRDCQMGRYCAGGVCVPTLAPGAQCSTNSQCVGACVDGVCCGSTCDHQCEACNIPGKEGICSPVKGAPSGLRQACASDGNEACAGACDGTNRDACVFPGSTKQCSAGACANGVATLTEFCDGAGSCPTAQHQICAPADCVGTKCGGDCATAACAAKNYCSAGVCVPKLPTGSACGADAQCANGLCTDGFCCNVACDGECQACNVAGLEGTCTTLSEELPHGGRAACPGFGACGSICDGMSATQCSYATMTTTCGKSSCAVGGDELSAPVCNGVGVCLPSATMNCGSYTCDPTSGVCLTSCVLDTDCSTGLICVNAKCQLQSDAGVDAGAPDGSPSDASDDGMAPDSAPDGSAGEGDAFVPTHKNAAKDGCGCSVPGSETGSSSMALIAGLLLLLGAASRRRGASREREVRLAARAR